MPSTHAVLSPSASERWLQCPASVRMEEKVPPEPESEFAAEGTAAHALAEIRASVAFGLRFQSEEEPLLEKWREEHQYPPEQEEEMWVHVSAYIFILREKLSEFPNSVILIEKRLDTGVPSCWGTADAVILSPYHVEIVDFKYGSGVAVEAEENPQLRLYGVGALETYDYLFGGSQKLVRMTVYQPRLHHLLSEDLTPEELFKWRDEVVIPGAKVALSDDAGFGPSEEACRWCAASGRCKPQLEAVFSEDLEADPDLLSPEEVAAAYSRVKAVQNWCIALERAALAQAYSEGIDIPGYKVVLSHGKRYVADPEGAIRVLTEEEGYDFDVVGKRSARGIGELEKLLGKERFSSVLGPYVRKTEGKPSLVRDTDSRRAINPNSEAKKEFQ